MAGDLLGDARPIGPIPPITVEEGLRRTVHWFNTGAKQT